MSSPAAERVYVGRHSKTTCTSKRYYCTLRESLQRKVSKRPRGGEVPPGPISRAPVVAVAEVVALCRATRARVSVGRPGHLSPIHMLPTSYSEAYRGRASSPGSCPSGSETTARSGCGCSPPSAARPAQACLQRRAVKPLAQRPILVYLILEPQRMPSHREWWARRVAPPPAAACPRGSRRPSAG